jgi:DNA-binding NarL/FixJ family response regulator
VPAHSAVIVDQWALVRLGIGAVLRSLGHRVVGDDASARDGLQNARDSQADLVVLGSHLDVAVDQAVRQAAAMDPPPRILVLLDTATRDELAALFAAGADGALLRSATGDELSDALTRLLAGERVLAPAFVPVLAGVMTSPAADGQMPRTDGALTPKEREVLALLAQGRSNRQIGEALFISGATVKTHLTHLYEKLGVKDRRQAIAQALAEGLLQ